MQMRLLKQINYSLCMLFSTLSKYFYMHANVPIVCFYTCRKTVPFIMYMPCSIQTFIFYVQKRSNLSKTIFAMIIVYINNVLVISCLSPKPSAMDLYLLIIPIGIHSADLQSNNKLSLIIFYFHGRTRIGLQVTKTLTQQLFCLQVTF